MNKTTMKARVSDQHLILLNEPLIASGGVDEVKICFEFCNLWDGCGKTAVFYRDPETVFHVAIVEGQVTVPNEVLADAGSFYFGVMGSASNIRTTEVLRVKVVDGAPTEATANHEEPTPDIYQQILAAYGEMEQKVAEAVAQISPLAAYPVGAIYMSVNATSPADIFGGTWQRLKDRFLLGAGDIYEAGETGGEAKHTLTVDELPAHSHVVETKYSKGETSDEIQVGVASYHTQEWWNESDESRFVRTETGGGKDQPHNNMPPYLAVYMWARTA